MNLQRFAVCPICCLAVVAFTSLSRADEIGDQFAKKYPVLARLMLPIIRRSELPTTRLLLFVIQPDGGAGFFSIRGFSLPNFYGEKLELGEIGSKR